MRLPLDPLDSLASLLEEPRPASPPPSRTRPDRVLAAVVASCGVLEVCFREDLTAPLPSLGATLVLASSMLWRRTHPLAAVASTFGTIVVIDAMLLAAGSPALDVYSLVAVLLLPYSLIRWGSGREAMTGLALVVGTTAMALVVSWTGVADAAGGLAVLVSSCVLGWAVRTQHGARERRLAEAKAQERVLLARELHDTIAHHVSAIAIQAQAGRALAATRPEAPLEALEVIEVEASRTLAEMRAMVGVLRSEAPVAYAPQPGVADLERLAHEASSSGPRVEVRLSGDVRALPTALDAAVFRIAQEAVTNARRHAVDATSIEVRVDAAPDAVSLLVRDDGARRTSAASAEPGFGLVGMQERASLLGGTCRAEPYGDRGWAVRASLPRQLPRATP